MHTRYALSWVALGLFVVGGCQPDTVDAGPSAFPGEQTTEGYGAGLVVETYNTGLAHGFVDHASVRVQPLVGALSESPADVLCLQEVWSGEDRRAIVSGLKHQFPYSWHTPVEQSFTPGAACGLRELFGGDKFVSCLQSKCGETQGDAQTDCVVNQCGGTLERLKTSNPACATALMAQVGRTAGSALWEVIRPWGEVGYFAYGGSNGLMLLSRKPLGSPAVFDLSEQSTLNRRAVLKATATLQNGVEVVVGCAHLAADLTKTAPYPGKYATWGDENRAQAEAVLRHFDDVEQPVVLAGDFNCSLLALTHGVMEELAGSCRAFEAHGYADAADAFDPRCTFCDDNPLAGVTQSERLDHIFVRDLKAISAERIIDRVFDLPDEFAGTSRIPLSDHYAVRAHVIKASE